MTRLKEIITGIRSCFSLSAHERLIIMLVMAIFLFGLFLRWQHLIQERADQYEPPKSEMDAQQK